jgi:hypothetical protein
MGNDEVLAYNECIEHELGSITYLSTGCSYYCPDFQACKDTCTKEFTTSCWDDAIGMMGCVLEYNGCDKSEFESRCYPDYDEAETDKNSPSDKTCTKEFTTSCWDDAIGMTGCVLEYNGCDKSEFESRCYPDYDEAETDNNPVLSPAPNNDRRPTQGTDLTDQPSLQSSRRLDYPDNDEPDEEGNGLFETIDNAAMG